MVHMRRIAAFGFLAFILMGCGSKPSMVGTWTIPVEKVPDLMATMTDDGKVQLNGTYQTFKLSASGTWVMKENSLTVKPEKLDIPDDIRAIVGPLIEKEEKKFLVPVTMEIEWVNDNEVRVTPPVGVSEVFNKPFVMRRQVASQ